MHLPVTCYNIKHNRHDSCDIRATQWRRFRKQMQKAEKYEETGFLQIYLLHFKNPSKNVEKKNNNKKEIPRIGHSATVSGDRQIGNTRYSAAAAAHTDSTMLVTRQRLNYWTDWAAVGVSWPTISITCSASMQKVGTCRLETHFASSLAHSPFPTLSGQSKNNSWNNNNHQ